MSSTPIKSREKVGDVLGDAHRLYLAGPAEQIFKWVGGGGGNANALA